MLGISPWIKGRLSTIKPFSFLQRYITNIYSKHLPYLLIYSRREPWSTGERRDNAPVGSMGNAYFKPSSSPSVSLHSRFVHSVSQLYLPCTECHRTKVTRSIGAKFTSTGTKFHQRMIGSLEWRMESISGGVQLPDRVVNTKVF